MQIETSGWMEFVRFEGGDVWVTYYHHDAYLIKTKPKKVSGVESKI